MNITELKMPMDTWLDALASDAPAPGGGAASAICGALGGALVSMVARFTMGRPKYAAVEAQTQVILAESERLRSELRDLVLADATAYQGVAHAYKLPKSTTEEQAARNAAIQAALVDATEVPLRIAEAARRVVELAHTIVAIGNKTVLSDAGAAALFGEAALRVALLNVHANVASLRNETVKIAFTKRVLAVEIGVAERVAQTLEHLTLPTV